MPIPPAFLPARRFASLRCHPFFAGTCVVIVAAGPYLEVMIVVARSLFFPGLLRLALAFAVAFALATPHAAYPSASNRPVAVDSDAGLMHDGAADGAVAGVICATVCTGSDPYALAEIDRPPVDAGIAAWSAELPFRRVAADPDPALRPPETLRPA